MTDTFSVMGFSILQTKGEPHVLVTPPAPLGCGTPLAMSSTHACPLAAPTKRSANTMARIATRYIPTSLVCRPHTLLEFHQSRDRPLRFPRSRQGTTALAKRHARLLRRGSSDTIIPARSHCGGRDNREH